MSLASTLVSTSRNNKNGRAPRRNCLFVVVVFATLQLILVAGLVVVVSTR
jgi:hypothetical protein